MKTPDEIKKGLEICAEAAEIGCINRYCPYGYLQDDDECCDSALCADALAYIQQLEAAVPRWISVEERLPEYGRYLVITRKGNGMTKVQTATYNNMGWWMHANFGEITHWMPLPEPPEV